jgi:hypothetical protein
MIMKITTATINREWHTAKAWLFEQINGAQGRAVAGG